MKREKKEGSRKRSSKLRKRRLRNRIRRKRKKKKMKNKKSSTAPLTAEMAKTGVMRLEAIDSTAIPTELSSFKR